MPLLPQISIVQEESNAFLFAQQKPDNLNMGTSTTNDLLRYHNPQSLHHKNLKYEYGESSETLCNDRINVVKNYVCEEMKKFIFNKNNVFELVCVDTRTGRTKSKILPLSQIL